MRISIRFLCWILVGAMFCAVSIGGGGGSSNLGSVNTKDGQNSGGIVTSGDTSGGRGDGWYGLEDVAFSEYVNGTWEIEYIDMVLDPDNEEIDLFCDIDGLPKLVLIGNSNNELSISTLDGRTTLVLTSDFYGYEAKYGSITARGLAIICRRTIYNDRRQHLQAGSQHQKSIHQ